MGNCSTHPFPLGYQATKSNERAPDLKFIQAPANTCPCHGHAMAMSWLCFLSTCVFHVFFMSFSCLSCLFHVFHVLYASPSQRSLRRCRLMTKVSRGRMSSSCGGLCAVFYRISMDFTSKIDSLVTPRPTSCPKFVDVCSA